MKSFLPQGTGSIRVFVWKMSPNSNIIMTYSTNADIPKLVAMIITELDHAGSDPNSHLFKAFSFRHEQLQNYWERVQK